ncbi:MAG: LytTR family DNA-binding domain-containing protein [Saprospiraceae bacterium]|nr:LytTR family DNA-binding domain-containing protein [Saprospiraceae bacterium]
MINCIAIDDEPLALKQIVKYIEDTPGLIAAGHFERPRELLEFLQEHEVDLMFVDINMPDLSGLDLVKSLTHPPRIIFTTAYAQYAVEGFKVDALDYLLKPISYPDFLRSTNKAKHYFSKKSTPDFDSDRPDFILVKSGFTSIKISLSKIRFIEGMREYVRIHRLAESPIMTLLSMKVLQQNLPSKEFLRVHKSYIVRLDQISHVERNRIFFDERTFIPIGKSYQKKFQDFLDSRSLG